MATAPRMRSAKVAGKRNSLPAGLEAPGETAHKQTEANDQSLATVRHGSGTLQEKLLSGMSVQPLESPNIADAAAELISKQLRAKTESLLRNFTRFSNIQEFERRLNRLFSDAATSYAETSLKESKPHAWVRKKIRSDRNAIVQQSAARVFLIRQSRSSLTSTEELRDDLEDRLDVAMRDGLVEADAFIEGSDQHAQNGLFSANYRLVEYEGKTLRPTPQQAKILEYLYEHKDREVTSEELHDKTKCSRKISDSFRSKDGKLLWGHLVIVTSRGRYKLNLSPQSRNQPN